MTNVLKATQTRDVLGTGGVIDTRHQGKTKRPTEERSDLDDWTPAVVKSPSLFRQIAELRRKIQVLSVKQAENIILEGSGSAEERK